MEQNQPLSEVTFLILLSLHTHPRHGYAIMKDVEALSNDRVQMSTGTLYGALKRLLEQKWIEPLDDTVIEGRKRKLYRLTELGQRILNAETGRLQSLVVAAQQRTAVSSI